MNIFVIRIHMIFLKQKIKTKMKENIQMNI